MLLYEENIVQMKHGLKAIENNQHEEIEDLTYVIRSQQVCFLTK